MADVLAGDPAQQRRWRINARTLAAVILLAVVVMTILTWVGPRTPADARQALVDSLITLDAGNFSAARNHAQAAVRAAPNSGMAHAILARAYLQLGEGLAADSELARARDAGMPPQRLHQLAAHAAFLQGDYAGAIAEATQAPPRYAGYAARIEARARAAQGATAVAVASLERLTAVNPRDVAAWTDLGRVRLSAGDLGGASAASARAVALASRDPVALTLRGEVIRTRLGLVAALPWFAAALRQDAYYHPALIEYAATLGDLGRYREMLAATRHAQAARPGSPQAFYLQAVLAARANRLDLARDLLGRTGGVIDQLPGAVLLSGSLDLAQGKNEQAIAMYRRVVGLQPLNVAARRLLGIALLRSGDWAGARNLLAPIAMRSDADAYTLTVAARAFEAGGDRDGAAVLLDRASRPDHAPAPVFASDAAVATLAAGAAQAPDDPNHVLGIIRSEIGAGNMSGAVSRARTLADAGPGSPAAQLALGDALVASGRGGDAASAYAHAADLMFDEPTMLRLVAALDRAARSREAAAALALFMSQNPANLTAQRLLGLRQLAAGLPAAAIDTMEGLRRRLGNRDAVLLAALSRACAANGRGKEAVRYGRAAYAVAPLLAEVVAAYAAALAANGNDEGARQMQAKLAALTPDRR